ncbi:hypothetical protein GO988_11370 [Hymenobacter sp. HMF4947]|uniref:Uncharacterized protein n=1 Tax=Hymenobacter ginkgonis TaxID=2682976 RepID=A0A7K1TEU7_9BACT|nr:hypothetical protein [Hymenobacter ginkgonis]MVN76924.1 hypothetical protein [Hymenobacter ginkgonis]
MSNFRFCKTIEVDGRQFLVRAANVAALAYPTQPRYQVEYKLVIDTTTPEGEGWLNLRLALEMENQRRLLNALECFDEQHARHVWILFDEQMQKTASDEELVAGAQLLEGILNGEVLKKYGLAGL